MCVAYMCVCTYTGVCVRARITPREHSLLLFALIKCIQGLYLQYFHITFLNPNQIYVLTSCVLVYVSEILTTFTELFKYFVK